MQSVLTKQFTQGHSELTLLNKNDKKVVIVVSWLRLRQNSQDKLKENKLQEYVFRGFVLS